MVFSTKDSVEVKHGGKVIMPPSALQKLAQLNITYPMLFKLSNETMGLYSHCGVLEFVAEEGRIYVPHWVGSGSLGSSLSVRGNYDDVIVIPQLMNQLDITEGDLVVVDNASLQLATFSKFQPQSKEFLDISNPKAVYPSCTVHTYIHTVHPNSKTTVCGLFP